MTSNSRTQEVVARCADLSREIARQTQLMRQIADAASLSPSPEGPSPEAPLSGAQMCRLYGVAILGARGWLPGDPQ